MSHSLKKIQRRNGGLVNAKSSKRKQLSKGTQGCPKKKDRVSSTRRDDAAHRGDDDMDATSSTGMRTDERKSIRAQLAKKVRLDEVNKRRGLAPRPGTKGAALNLESHRAIEAAIHEVETPLSSIASAAASRALSAAPRDQRTFQRELAKVLSEADVLIEVLDARDPMGCRCPTLEEAVMRRFTKKRIVLLLNKVDLVPAENAKKWLAYLRQYFPTLPFRASGGGGGGGGGSAGVAAYGASQLLQLLKNYSRSLGLKTSLTVGIVGYPNVGKSSLINALKRARAVAVGSTPGVTTHAQLVAIDRQVKLIDSPGIVFARARTDEEAADVLLRNCVRVETIDNLEVPIEAILRRCDAAYLRELYGVEAFDSTLEFLTLVAMKRGMLRKGGAADHDVAARAVLQEWNSGHIKYCSAVPEKEGSVEVVTQLADEFDWDAEPPRVVDEEPAEGAGSSSAAGVGGAGETMETEAPQAAASAFGANAMQPLAVRAGASIERGKSQRTERARKKAMKKGGSRWVDEDAKYNVRLNAAISKTQKTEKRNKRRERERNLAAVKGMAR